ncbi:radical SAM protein [Candidatus Bathyarchaeota archaeon]|nr:radical SAM protein [Candidatus Bathyarchaeota archaeon]
MSHKKDDSQWPYAQIEHWPPMTYRNRLKPSSESIQSLNDFLNTENSKLQNREIQPWIPFCEGRCAFCYFPVRCERETVASYLAALKKALSLYSENKYVKSSFFNELYVGGGSPSVLQKDQIVDLLQFCRKTFNLSETATTKFTACTNSLSEEKIDLLASNNVDQLDIGIQTFDDSLRKILALRDTAQEAKKKLRIAKKHDLNISIDLLYNLPGQTVDQWQDDIKQALELEVESVDCYPLDLYSNTPLARRITEKELPYGDTATELKMYLDAYSIFKENGYLPTCHNRFSRLKEDFNEPSSEVVGSGAGFFMGHIGNFLYSDIVKVEDYITSVKAGSLPIARLATLSREDEMRRAMMMVYIRIPVDRAAFKAKFGIFPEDAFPEAIEKLRQKNLITINNGKIRLTEEGDPWRFNISWEFFNSR